MGILEKIAHALLTSNNSGRNREEYEQQYVFLCNHSLPLSLFLSLVVYYLRIRFTSIVMAPNLIRHTIKNELCKPILFFDIIYSYFYYLFSYTIGFPFIFLHSLFILLSYYCTLLNALNIHTPTPIHTCTHITNRL